MQIGRGREPITTSFDTADVEMDFYRYKNSITDDIRNVDLIISHAGIKL
jgi:hypothetical protein